MFKHPVLLIAATAVAAILAFSLWRTSDRIPDPASSAQDRSKTSAKQGTVQKESNQPLTSKGDADSIKAAATSRAEIVSHPDPAGRIMALSGMSAECEMGGKKQMLSGSDGLFDRVLVKPDQPLHLKLSLPNLSINQDVIVTAPNGGKLSRADGGRLRFPAKAASENLNLVFQPGISPGAYSVIVMHRGVSQTLDFWVGPQHALGQPGPAYTSTSSTN